jgi:hypothetical protein
MLLSFYLQPISCKCLESDREMYFWPADCCYLLLYVDDELIAAGLMADIDNVKELPKAKWQWSSI